MAQDQSDENSGEQDPRHEAFNNGFTRFQPVVQPARAIAFQEAFQRRNTARSHASDHSRSAPPASTASTQQDQTDTISTAASLTSHQRSSQSEIQHQMPFSVVYGYPSPTPSASTSSPPDVVAVRPRGSNLNSFISLFPPSAQGSDGHRTNFLNNDVTPLLDNYQSNPQQPHQNHLPLNTSHITPRLRHPGMVRCYEMTNDRFQGTSEHALQINSLQLLRQPRPQPTFADAVNNGFDVRNRSSTSGIAPQNYTRNAVFNTNIFTSSLVPFGTTTGSTERISPNFRPSRMVMQARGIIPEQHQLGMHYKGDLNSKSFRSVVYDLPPPENCALWVTNIPLTARHCHLFDLIQEGAVWAMHLCDPTDAHPTRAAKLIFTNPYAAGRFLTRANTNFGIQVHGNSLKVMYNRDGHRARNGQETRILLIEGPRSIMTYEFWESQFNDACIYQLDRWQYLPTPDPERPRLEFRFARVDGQAQTCKQMIALTPCFAECVSVQYGLDPCDPYIQYLLATQNRQ